MTVAFRHSHTQEGQNDANGLALKLFTLKDTVCVVLSMLQTLNEALKWLVKVLVLLLYGFLT